MVWMGLCVAIQVNSVRFVAMEHDLQIWDGVRWVGYRPLLYSALVCVEAICIYILRATLKKAVSSLSRDRGP